MAIAIDLGTANTRAGIFDGNHYRIFRDESNNDSVPSYVAFTHSGVLVGKAALNNVYEDPSNTVYDIIHLLGRNYSDPIIQMGSKQWPFKVVPDVRGKAMVLVHYRGKAWQLSPEEVCSIILMRIKKIAESTIGCIVTGAVIAIPAYFNYAQRRAVKYAGRIAGLFIKKLVSAPVAAAMYHGFERIPRSTPATIPLTNIRVPYLSNDPVEYNLVIFDLGAGTLNVSLVTFKEDTITVLATVGDIHLGSNNFDNQMVDFVVNDLKIQYKKDISITKTAISRLTGACERAKIALSYSETVPLNINEVDLGVPFNFHYVFTKALFEDLNKDILQRCICNMDTCCKEAGMSINMIDHVVLVGGSTKIPILQQLIRNHFCNNRSLYVAEPVELDVTYGAAILASQLSSKKNDKGRHLSLFDATPFSLGIQTTEGVGGVVVPKNTRIPTRKLAHFNNYHYYQQNCIFKVYEGEHLLANIELSGINSPYPRNNCRYRVCFDIDDNGTLTVTVEDTFCGIKKGIVICSSKDILSVEVEDSIRRVLEILRSEEEHATIRNHVIAESSQPITAGKSSNLIEEPKEFAIGIDLGTTNSCVGVWRRNRVELIANEYGSRTTLSCVSFTETERLIGDAAKQQLTMNATNTIINVKRLIGRHYLDQFVQNDKETLPFKVMEGPNGGPVIAVQYKGEEKLFRPEEITAMVLRKMKEQAEQHTNSKIKNVVITVPSYFSNSQRKATRHAGLIAGLNVMQLLNETTSAAITYYLHKSSLGSFDEKNVVVFDLGGGTFDVSVLRISNGKIKVLAVLGDNLGGEDFDTILVNHFVEQFNNTKNVPKGKSMSDNPRSLRRLRAACEKAKRVLSTVPKTNIDLDAIYNQLDFNTTITKEKFEDLNAEFISKCMVLVNTCLENAKMDKKNIDDIVLIGGSTRIPMLQQVLQKFFGKEHCKSINPDEAVAYGAAVLAAKLSDDKKFKEFEIQEAASLSVGVEIGGGAMHLLVPRYSTIPVHMEQVFTTYKDDQSKIEIALYECELLSNYKAGLMGKFLLSAPRKTGAPKICVNLDIDSSGILSLNAHEMDDSKLEIAIEELESLNLTKKDIEDMMRVAEELKVNDDNQKKQAEEMNALENFAFRVRDRANSQEIDTSKKKKIEEVTDEVLNWLVEHPNAMIEEINNKKQQLESLLK